MFCKSCGAKLYKNAKFCALCGDKVEEELEDTNPEISADAPIPAKETTTIQTDLSTPTQTTSTERKFSGKAITGFVLSLVAFIIAGIPCSVIGIIFSSLALSDIKRKNYSGKGLAIAGLVLSIIALVLSIFLAIDTISTMLSYLYY